LGIWGFGDLGIWGFGDLGEKETMPAGAHHTPLMKRKKREKGKEGKEGKEGKKGKKKKIRRENELDEYVDSNNQLRDQAIDRFCSATCKLAELHVASFFPTSPTSPTFPTFPTSLTGKQTGIRKTGKGRIVWISSLAFEAALNAARMPGATQADVQRRLGFKDISIEDCDVVLGSVYSEAHWSLLVLYLKHRSPEGGRARAFHYDSIYGLNTNKARAIVEMLSRAGILLPDVCIDNPPDFPQQRDTYECGHVVLMTVNSVATKYKRFAHSPTAPLTVIDYPDISEERIERIRTNIIKRVLG